MRFQCLEVTCGKPFGWTAKRIVSGADGVVTEYVVCPYCGSLDFEEYSVAFPLKKGMPPQKSETSGIKKVQRPQITPISSTDRHFDPADLMEHQGWKNKKTGENQYTAGSLNWGWDYKDRFAVDTVAALEQGAVTIQGHDFTLDGKLVSVKKVKT